MLQELGLDRNAIRSAVGFPCCNLMQSIYSTSPPAISFKIDLIHLQPLLGRCHSMHRIITSCFVELLKLKSKLVYADNLYMNDNNCKLGCHKAYAYFVCCDLGSYRRLSLCIDEAMGYIIIYSLRLSRQMQVNTTLEHQFASQRHGLSNTYRRISGLDLGVHFSLALILVNSRN